MGKVVDYKSKQFFVISYSITNPVTGILTNHNITVSAISDKVAEADFKANCSANKKFTGIRKA